MAVVAPRSQYEPQRGLSCQFARSSSPHEEVPFLAMIVAAVAGVVVKVCIVAEVAHGWVARRILIAQMKRALGLKPMCRPTPVARR